MAGFGRLRRFTSPAALVRYAAVPVVFAVVIAGLTAPAPASTAPAPHGAAAREARAESEASVARSRLTTAELISAARQAGSRLRVHTRPPAPRGIPVHPPIIVQGHHAAPQGTSVGGASRPAMRVKGGAALALSADLVSAPGSSSVPLTCVLCYGPLSGSMWSPDNESQSSNVFSLYAELQGGCKKGTFAPCGADNYTGVTFQYRVGITGAFSNIPPGDVSTSDGSSVTWPAPTICDPDYPNCTGAADVTTPFLDWHANQTILHSALLQIQAVFTDSHNGSYTTSPVTVTLDTSGVGSDFATAQVGPVTVGLQSGNLSLAATDVSIASYGTALTVSRSFGTLDILNGAPSAFGPGWTSSLPVLGTTMRWSSVTDDGSYAVLTASDGSSQMFAAGTTINGVTSYTGLGQASAQGLNLTKSSSGFTLTDPSGDQVQFAAANTRNPTRYTPSQITQPGTSRSVGYIYDPTGSDASYGQPLLMLAPNPNLPSGTSSTTACPYPASASTWTAGCRGIQFSYNSSGNLTQVNFVSYDGSTLTNTAVAAYSYDLTGRLAGEWDPRISPNLVTTYSYDENSSDSTYGWPTSVSPAQAGTGYLEPWTFTYDTTSGSADYGKLVSVTRTHSNGTAATQTIVYEVPLTTAAGGPLNMDASTVGTWNQTDPPASAAAIFPATHVPSSPPSANDWQYAQVTYYDANGRQVDTATYGSGAWNVATTQYDGYGDEIGDLTAANRAEALAAGSSSASVAAELETVSEYTAAADGSQELTDIYRPLHNANVPGQGVQQIRDHVHYVYDQGAPSTGGPYDVITTQTDSASIGAGIPGASDTDSRTTQSVYSNGSDNTGWTLRTPVQTITDPGGLAITTTTVYNENSNLYGGEPLLVEGCVPSDTSCNGAGTQVTIYYTAGANPVDSGCGSEPTWADLVCKTEPAAQPGTSGLPNLPVTSYTYNVYLEPLTKTETFGTSARSTTYTYDPAGRQTRVSIGTSGSGMGAAVQDQVTVYSPHTGQVTDTESVNSSGTVTGDVKDGYNDFGVLTSYTDASGNVTSYDYDLADRVTSRNDGQGTISYSYDTQGLVSSETDSQAGTFSATYNPDGSLLSEAYAGGYTASYGYDENGTQTSVSYAGGSWTSALSQNAIPDNHGDWASQTITDGGSSPVQAISYSYDQGGRLTNAQDTVGGQCTTRSYQYDKDSNRVSLTTYPPGSGGVCQSSTGTTENYAYDGAGRLTTSTVGATVSSYSYDTLGDITMTPSADEGGNGNLAATYYANGAPASQSQQGPTGTQQSTSWTLDPTLQRAESQAAPSGTNYANHYSNDASSPSWISPSVTYQSPGSWTRYITGINGMLAAQVDTSGTSRTVTVLFPDLNNNIMAAQNLGTSDSAPLVYMYGEYGTTDGNAGQYPVYGWAGGKQVSNQALGPSYLVGSHSYNPFNGLYSQPDAGSYSFANPPIGDPCATNSAVTSVWTGLGRIGVAWARVYTYYCWNGLLYGPEPYAKVTYVHSWLQVGLTQSGEFTGWSYNGSPSGGIQVSCYVAYESYVNCSGVQEYYQADFVQCLPVKFACWGHAYPYLYEAENYRGYFFTNVHGVWLY